MRVETAIGAQIARLRETRQMSLSQLGEAMGRYLDKPWSRQAVHQAERGRRAFTAAELAALALVLDTSVPALFHVDAEPIELPGAAVSPQDYRGILLYAGDYAPLDGVDELMDAVHDISKILSRPAVARLAKIASIAADLRGRFLPGGRKGVIFDAFSSAGHLSSVPFSRRCRENHLAREQAVSHARRHVQPGRQQPHARSSGRADRCPRRLRRFHGTRRTQRRPTLTLPRSVR
jgi:transcriptional regulator with XRE-family HTH domain